MENINTSIFKSYDIRGIYPNELNLETAYAIGRALIKKTNVSEVVIGMDMRLGGPELKKELIRGITDEGANILDIGLVPIDAVYFAVRIENRQAGIMITASHNPKEYNGFKIPLAGIGWIRGEDLKNDVLNLSPKISEKKGAIKEIDVMDDYIKHVFSFCDVKKIKPYKVVVDAGNGMAGKIIPLLEPLLPIKVIPLNFKLDGNFPAHPSNPLMPESQVEIKKTILEEKADFGIIMDGDTDRLFFVDEKGEFIPADLTLLILAREFLNREPGAGIVYNVICSKIVPEKITEWGGKPIRSAVGFINLMNAMKEHNGIMSGEVSAHYAFRDNGYADSGFIAFLVLLQLLSQDGRPISEMVKEFRKYYRADEVNIEIEDKKGAIKKVKEYFSDGEQDELDGVTVEYEDWWFNVRPSNTESLLRITVEANTKEIATEKTKKILEIMK